MRRAWRPPSNGRFEENAHHFVGCLRIGITGADGDDIRVVMGARETHFIGIERERGANAVHFIGRDRHADAGGADQDAAVGGAGDHVVRDGAGVIGIVGRFGGVGADVDHFMPGLTQRVADLVLQSEAARDLRQSQFSWGTFTLAGARGGQAPGRANMIAGMKIFVALFMFLGTLASAEDLTGRWVATETTPNGQKRETTVALIPMAAR